MTDFDTTFMDLDADIDMIQFHVSDDESSMASDWPPTTAQVDWDWASKASQAMNSRSSSGGSGFLTGWKEGPLPDIFNLDDDLLTPVPESAQAESPVSASEEESLRPEVKCSPMAISSRRWTEAEIQALKEGVAEYGTGNWKSIQADSRFSALLGDRVRSSLHRKWSRIKAKSLKDGEPLNLGPKPEHKPTPKPIPIPKSSPQNIQNSTALEHSRSPFMIGSWSHESTQPSINRNCMAQSLPAQPFQFQWNPMSSNDRSQPHIPRSSPIPVGFQPGSAPHPVHMAVCVDPAAPPRSPFIPPTKARYPSSFMSGPAQPGHSGGLSSLSLPKQHGFASQAINPQSPPRHTLGLQPLASQPIPQVHGLCPQQLLSQQGCSHGSQKPPHGLGSQPLNSNLLSQPPLGLSSQPMTIQSPAASSGLGSKPQLVGPQSILNSHPTPTISNANSQNKSRRWTTAQAQVLIQAVSVHGESRWREILTDEKFASFFAGRSPQSLVRKWNRIQNNTAKRQPPTNQAVKVKEEPMAL